MKHYLNIALQDLPQITEVQKEKLLQHWELIKAWNQKTNLTAIKNDEEAAWLHYRDSLEALNVNVQSPLLDIGSGAGFPGIPLAIALPEIKVTLLEPRQKRVSFLQTVVARLRLTNVTVLNGRIEDTPSELFATGVTRATFSDEADLQKCFNWLRPFGQMIFYRSQHVINKLAGYDIHPYHLQQTVRVLEIRTSTRAG